ncbi:MAG: hypothetical protein IPO92_13100 [Saprospiraceae bacterium]|nr:hypothetical protein [Saprospiraceae bacterium]
MIFNCLLSPSTMPEGLTKVPATIQSKGWEFTVLADSKQELQQALNFERYHRHFCWIKRWISFMPTTDIVGDELKLEEKNCRT